MSTQTSTPSNNFNIGWYQKINNRKQPWTPIEGCKGDIDPLYMGIIRRILSIRNLEADVASWISYLSQSSDDAIPPEILSILQENILDEVRHEESLDNLVIAENIVFTPTELIESVKIQQMWTGLQDSPVVLAGSMESGVFMPLLLMLRTWGSVSMGVTARDISGDEGSHAPIHRQVAKDLGLSVSLETRKAVIDTISWIIGDLNVAGTRGNKRRWVQFSLDLLDKGICKEFEDSEVPVMLAPFENNNLSIPSYS